MSFILNFNDLHLNLPQTDQKAKTDQGYIPAEIVAYLLPMNKHPKIPGFEIKSHRKLKKNKEFTVNLSSLNSNACTSSKNPKHRS